MRLALAVLSLLTTAEAKPIQLLVLLSGGPGDTATAEKPLRAFLTQWEQGAGVSAGSLEGKYFPQKDAALAFQKEQKPGVYMLPAVTFFEYEKAWGLTAIAQVAVKGSAAEPLYLVVKKGDVQDVSALKGKTIATSLLADAKIADLIALENDTAIAKVANLEYDRSPLSALRKVREGTAAAVLLDEAQYAGIEKLPFASELTLLAKTKPIPRAIIAVGKTVDKATAAKLKDGLMKMAKAGEAGPTLQQFGADGIVPADEPLLAAARKRMGAKK